MNPIVESQVNGEYVDLAKEFEKTNEAALNAQKEHREEADHQEQSKTEQSEKSNLQEQAKTEQSEKAKPAKRIHEDGNANNVYNFNYEIAAVTVFGPLFAPNNPLLPIPHLNAVLSAAQDALANVNATFNAFKQALDARQALYERMLTLATQMMGELRSCGASKATIEKATSYKRKLEGKRVKKTDPNSTDKIISAAQTSFAQRFNHFDGLIGVCEIEPLYNPSTDNLKIVELKAYLAEMQAANSAAALGSAKLTSARTERNKILYSPVTGLVDIAIAVKEYVKAVFGFKTPEYRSVSHLKFKNLVKL